MIRKWVSAVRDSVKLQVLVLLIVVALGASVASLMNAGGYTAEWRAAWFQTVSAAAFGAVMMFLLLELFVGERQQQTESKSEIGDLKLRLVREAGSIVNATALRAVEQLKERGWLEGDEGLLKGADLQEANLSGADVGEANLSGADLRHANLSGADLRYANLSDANVGEADLSGANLRETNLSGANMWKTNLSGASLPKANLSGAYIGEANLYGARLVEANLSSANLWQVNLSGVNLWEAEFDESTVLPDGNRWTPDTDMTRYTAPGLQDM